MIPVPMPEIKTTLAGKPLVVEGGWFAHVPTVTMDEESEAGLIAYFQASGMTPFAAAEKARETVQLTLSTAYKKHHGDAVRRYAKIYARRFPHLWDRETGKLQGFDAGMMARQCQPWERVTQRRKRMVRVAMEGMATEATRGSYAI